MKKNLLTALRTCGAVLLFLAAWSAASAASSSIGLAVASGSFQVDHSQVWGSASLFEGSQVETSGTASQIQVNGRADARLAAGSRLTVYHQHMVLEEGSTEVQAAPEYPVEAGAVAVAAETRGARARIRRIGAGKVTVAALGGAVLVRNSGGLLVALVQPGESLDFEPRSDGATAPTRISGCLLEKGGKTILADQTTNVVLELKGPDLAKEVGSRVEIIGMEIGAAAAGSGAEVTIQVAGWREIAKGGCTATAKKVGASAVAVSASKSGAGTAAGTSSAGGGAAGSGSAGAAGAGAAGAGAAGAGAAAGGLGAGTIAVIGGVAAAATVGGLAATGSLPGQSQSTPSASR